MGNAILQAYDVEERPFGCGGLKGMWLLYHAKHKGINWLGIVNSDNCTLFFAGFF